MAALTTSVNLYSLQVEERQKSLLVYHYQQNNRLILKRSKAMENFVIAEVNKVLNDFHEMQDIYEGLIYIMYKINNGMIVPL